MSSDDETSHGTNDDIGIEKIGQIRIHRRLQTARHPSPPNNYNKPQLWSENNDDEPAMPVNDENWNKQTISGPFSLMEDEEGTDEDRSESTGRRPRSPVEDEEGTDEDQGGFPNFPTATEVPLTATEVYLNSVCKVVYRLMSVFEPIPECTGIRERLLEPVAKILQDRGMEKKEKEAGIRLLIERTPISLPLNDTFIGDATITNMADVIAHARTVEARSIASPFE